MKKKVIIYTDGSCLNNPGPGGYGAILRCLQYEKLFSAGYCFTTNNRMELMGAIVAIESLIEPCKIILSTDSQYLRQGITIWMNNWIKNEWKRSDKKLVKNIDLWKRLYSALIIHDVQWQWIKGHSGNPENEFCDKLAKKAANQPNLKDTGYQNNTSYYKM